MSDKATVNREALLKTIALVRPALATQTFIPAYNHIAFDGESALAHNDITAIEVRCPFPEPCCIPGDLLIKALGSFSAESVLIQRMGQEQTVLVSSGRSKLKLPTLPRKQFPFEFPNEGYSDYIRLESEIMGALNKCLISAGNNPNHPSTMGVTLDVDDHGNAVLYATDNYTVSMHGTKTKIKLPGASPVILPTFFCNQLLSLLKAFPDLKNEIVLFLYPGALQADFGDHGYEASLFTKTIADIEPLDFDRMLKRHVNLKELEKLSEIPGAFDSAFARQLLVLGNEADKVTRATYDDGVIKLHSQSQTGESDEAFPFDGPKEPMDFYVDPTYVVRASKLCDRMALGNKVLILASGDSFVHIIAHVSAPAPDRR